MKTVVIFLISFAATYFIFLGHFSNSVAKEPESQPEIVAEESVDAKSEPEVLAEVSAIDEQVEPTPEPRPKADQPLAETPEPTQTPIPEPTATPDVWSPPDMEPIFAKYAGMYGVDKNILERLAVCESHFNPDAVSGDYVGMFQFSTRTWQDYRMKLGLDANLNLRHDIEASIQTAAFMIQQRGTAPWPRCI